MVKFDEIWVMDSIGITYLHYATGKETIPSQLFTGFLSAVQSMTAECIDAIKMKDSKVIIFPVQKPVKIFIVGRARMKEKDKDIRKQLEKMGESFVKEYESILMQWNGDVNQFEPFLTKIKAFID